MGWDQKIDYVDVEVTPRPPVKKQVWDGEKFVPVTLYRHKGLIGHDAEQWMLKTFGPAGTYKNGRFWDFSRAGDFTVMDERIYTWYKIKWGNK